MASPEEMNTPGNTRLTDGCDRRLNYFRISVTDRCNLQCSYCMPDDRIQKLSHEDILTYEEILRVVDVSTRLGIDKVRITGGEPLVRKGVVQFLEKLCAMPSLSDVSLTTNGLLLSTHLDALWDAGVRRINVSLDTLASKKYRAITGVDGFQQVWDGLMNALEIGFSPIKINVVAMMGVNDDEIAHLAALTREYPFHVRFIEYMPIGNSSLNREHQLLVPQIRERIEQSGALEPVAAERRDGPAVRYRYRAAPGEIGFISSISNHFCSTCNRLRLTASGRLRPCLLSDKEIDLHHLLRGGCTDTDIREAIFEAISLKGAHHHVHAGEEHVTCRQMSSIGG